MPPRTTWPCNPAIVIASSLSSAVAVAWPSSPRPSLAALGSDRSMPAQKAVPVRQYLEDSVVPVLRKALRELVKVRPEDPFDFLAAYVLENKPAA